MIRTMFNLKCAAGHKHFSPHVDYYVGRHCFSPVGEKSKCQELLAKITPATK